MQQKIPLLDRFYYKEIKKTNLASVTQCYEIWKKAVIKNKQYQNNLLVIPGAGLGNRLRVMAVSWNLAKKCKKKVSFFWGVNSDLGCNWEDLFVAPIIDWQSDLLCFDKSVYINKNSKHVIDELVGLGFSRDNIFYKKKYPDKDFNIYSCWFDFPQRTVLKPYVFYYLLKPIDKIKKILDKFCPLGSKKLGIHLRYTDAPIKRNIDWIISYVKLLIKKYPSYEILVTADNQEVKDKVLDVLPLNKVHYQKTNLFSGTAFSTDRNNIKGMQSATADLFALADCEILWSNKPNGSFYQAAAQMPLQSNIAD